MKLRLVKNLENYHILGAYDSQHDIIFTDSTMPLVKKIIVIAHELGHKLISMCNNNPLPNTTDGKWDFSTSFTMPRNTTLAIRILGLKKYYYLRVHRYDGLAITVYDDNGELKDVVKP